VIENGNPSVPGADDVTLTRLSAPLFYIVGRVSNVRLLGGSYGPAVNDHPQIKPYNLDNQVGPRNVLLDGVTLHDFTRDSPEVHTECLQVYAGTNITIRRSRFTNCDGTAALAIGKIGSAPMDGVLVENNWFDKRGDTFYGIGLSYDIRNLVFRYNSASKAIAFLNRPENCTMGTCGPYAFVGNYMPVGHGWCDRSRVTYRHNVWRGARCSETDRNVGALAFVNEDAFDLHLSPNSSAVCSGDPKNHPGIDIDGQRRTKRFRPDAGADQAARTARPRSLMRVCAPSSKAAPRRGR
jgi:hypothetical protein